MTHQQPDPQLVARILSELAIQLRDDIRLSFSPALAKTRDADIDALAARLAEDAVSDLP